MSIDILLGKTITEITGTEGDERIVFETSDGKKYKMFHEQDCCEQVYLEDVTGDFSDLIGSPIVQAEESSSQENPPEFEPDGYQDSFTWTFYRLATNKGTVVLRWYGESNGYYSESVDVVEV